MVVMVGGLIVLRLGSKYNGYIGTIEYYNSSYGSEVPLCLYVIVMGILGMLIKWLNRLTLLLVLPQLIYNY